MLATKGQQSRKEIVTYLTGDDAIFKNEKSVETLDDWGFATLGEAYFGLDRFKEALFFYQKYGEQKPRFMGIGNHSKTTFGISPNYGLEWTHWKRILTTLNL